MSAVTSQFGAIREKESSVTKRCRSEDNILYHQAMQSVDQDTELRRVSRCSDLSLTRRTDQPTELSGYHQSHSEYHCEANAASLITMSIRLTTDDSSTMSSYPSVFSSPTSELSSSSSSSTSFSSANSSTSGSLYLSPLDLESTDCSSFDYTLPKPKMSSTDHCFLDESSVFSPVVVPLRLEDNSSMVSNSTPIHKCVKNPKFVFSTESPIPLPRHLVPRKFEFPSIPNSLTKLCVSDAVERVVIASDKDTSLIM